MTNVGKGAVFCVGLAVGVFLYQIILNDTGEQRADEGLSESYVPPLIENTVDLTNDAPFYITAADELVYGTSTDLAADEAQQQCESVAYNTDYMWQQVICVHNGVEIYNDVFVAG